MCTGMSAVCFSAHYGETVLSGSVSSHIHEFQAVLDYLHVGMSLGTINPGFLQKQPLILSV